MYSALTRVSLFYRNYAALREAALRAEFFNGKVYSRLLCAIRGLRAEPPDQEFVQENPVRIARISSREYGALIRPGGFLLAYLRDEFKDQTLLCVSLGVFADLFEASQELTT